jgi:hypothetical protein
MGLRHWAAPALLACAGAAVPTSGVAQLPDASADHTAVLRRDYPQAYALLLRLQTAQAMAYAHLARDGDAVRAEGGGLPSPGFESDLVRRLTELINDRGAAEDAASEASAGYAVLGETAADILRKGQAFQLEVLGILADPEIADRRGELARAVERYRSQAATALPNAPKDMDVLYDHPQAFAFRTRYPDLGGLLWAGHWLRLAATEPLTDFSDPDQRAAGLDTVVNRYHEKLSDGEPPRAFPSQIPLAPAIAPGFIYMSPEAAMIWDNLSLMQEVLADILASPAVTDVRAALDSAIQFFRDPDARVTERADWESMALQHGIFFQGGYPLAVMTRSELNGDGHAAHARDGGAPQPMPIIPN